MARTIADSAALDAQADVNPDVVRVHQVEAETTDEVATGVGSDADHGQDTAADSDQAGQEPAMLASLAPIPEPDGLLDGEETEVTPAPEMPRRLARGTDQPSTSKRRRRRGRRPNKSRRARGTRPAPSQDHTQTQSSTRKPTHNETLPSSASVAPRAKQSTEKSAGTRRERAFLPPVWSEGEDPSRRGPLTLAVIILVIVATITMSYLLRRPSDSGAGVTRMPSDDTARDVRAV